MATKIQIILVARSKNRDLSTSQNGRYDYSVLDLYEENKRSSFSGFGWEHPSLTK